MRHLHFIIVVILLVCSCQDIPSVDKPEHFFEQKLMEDIMYESALINAARGYNVAMLKLIGLKPETHIYDKYNMDSLTYAQNLEYYTSDVEVYMEMNTKVLKRIQEQFSIDDSLESTERKLKDSLRTMRAKEIKSENKELDSLGIKKSRFPTRTVTDSFARRYRKGINTNDSL